jgi:hypothetical protein
VASSSSWVTAFCKGNNIVKEEKAPKSAYNSGGSPSASLWALLVITLGPITSSYS